MQAQCFLSEWKVIWIAREVRYMLLLSVNQLLCKTEKYIGAILKAWGKNYLTILNEPLQGKGKDFSLKINYYKSRYEKRRNIFRLYNIWKCIKMNSEIGRKKKNVELKVIQHSLVFYKRCGRYRVARKRTTPLLPGKDWTNNVSVGKLYLNPGQQIMMTIIENKHAHILITIK